jgi:hypothetical protein
MAWVTPPTFVSGGTVTAANLNILGDDLLYLKGIADGVTASGVQVTRAAAQSVTTSTSTTLSFSAEVWDFGGWWSSGTAITVPAGAIPAGYTNILVYFDAEVRVQSNATGARALTIYKNGSETLPGRRVAAVNGDSTDFGLSRFVQVAAGDVLSLRGYQNSGSSLDFSNIVVTCMRYAPAS